LEYYSAMSKNWLTIIVIAIGMMLLFTGYEIYKSITGQNVKFTKTVTQIENNLNTPVLDAFFASREKIVIKTDNLSNK